MNKNTYNIELFSAGSPWNTPISSTAQVDPNSGSMISNLGLAFSNSHAFNVNITSNAVPIYYADVATPWGNCARFDWLVGRFHVCPDAHTGEARSRR
jgi:hypothetical protein